MVTRKELSSKNESVKLYNEGNSISKEKTKEQLLKEYEEKTTKLAEEMQRKKEIHDRTLYGSSTPKEIIRKSYNKYGEPTLKNLQHKGYFIIDPFQKLVLNDEDGLCYKALSLAEIKSELKKSQRNKNKVTV